MGKQDQEILQDRIAEAEQKESAKKRKEKKKELKNFLTNFSLLIVVQLQLV